MLRVVQVSQRRSTAWETARRCVLSRDASEKGGVCSPSHRRRINSVTSIPPARPGRCPSPLHRNCSKRSALVYLCSKARGPDRGWHHCGSTRASCMFWEAAPPLSLLRPGWLAVANLAASDVSWTTRLFEHLLGDFWGLTRSSEIYYSLSWFSVSSEF